MMKESLECPVQMIFICIVTLHGYTWILRRDQLFQDNNIIGITIEIAFTHKKKHYNGGMYFFFPVIANFHQNGSYQKQKNKLARLQLKAKMNKNASGKNA